MIIDNTVNNFCIDLAVLFYFFNFTLDMAKIDELLMTEVSSIIQFSLGVPIDENYWSERSACN